MNMTLSYMHLTAGHKLGFKLSCCQCAWGNPINHVICDVDGIKGMKGMREE